MFTVSTLTANTSTTLNLRRLFVLRNIGIAGQALVIGIAIKWFKLPLPLFPLIIILGGLVCWNLLTGWRVRSRDNISDREFFIQLAIDVLALTGVLYFSGGATNPFAWFFLLPLMIASTVLPRNFSWLMAGLTVGCYSLLMLYYVPLDTVHVSHNSDFQQHVFGMWSGFIISAGIVAYFVTGMASTLRERDRVLAETREQALRDERLVALGTLAAGAAHELGTPLGTMAIVSGELAQEYPATKDSDLNEKLNIIQDQIARCKDALSVISASAGEARADAGESILVENYLEQLIDDWHGQRPDIILQHHFEGGHPSPFMIADRALTQAITNILNNAADASPDNVEMNARWNHDELVINIYDSGPGFSKTASASVGKNTFTTKEQGLGLGLFLAHAAIERLGGNVELFNRQTGGVCTQISLPLNELSGNTHG